MGGLTRRAIIAGAALAVIIAGAFAVLLSSISQLREAQLRLERSTQVLVSANRLERLVVDMETGLRGFALTGDEDFLEPWHAASAVFPGEAQTLASLVADDPAQQARTREISDAGSAYMREYAIPLIDTARRDPAAARTTQVTQEGKQRIDALRADFDAMVATEQAAADNQRRSANEYAMRATAAGIAGLAGSLLLIAAYTGYVTRAVVAPVRRVAGAAQRLAAGDLGARVAGRGVGEVGVLKNSFNTMAATLARNSDELAASRQRIVTAADQARRRIERDLHDGIQQRLVAFVLDTRAAREMVSQEDRPELAGQLDRLTAGLGEAVNELREISRGIHPAILSEAGLAVALKALGRRSPVPVELDLDVAGRLPEPVEVCAYYVVSEALANAAKHAQASFVTIRAHARDGLLRLEISDDGVGGAASGRGSGLVGLTDRVEALGGTVTVTSPPGEGTTLAADLPIAAN
ncbi:CHASE3 domain-containing protein [Allorhizocola rhizosphaerae]|uniref:CHASE3 domain-containing protein n=1 Tax=Allorhizocola rhizosphaerae TaxID=1872709 RepID=UPI000E3E094F|nr:CHASE3 domain-containing protein [Allorhizocola rhizosphaerae]